MRSFPIALAILLAALTASAGCGNLTPSDEPLPTFEELQARYGPQAPGTGVLLVTNSTSGNGRVSVTATHSTYGEEYGENAITSFSVRLLSADGLTGVALDAFRVRGSELRPGQELSVGAVGTGDGNKGGGRLRITAVDGGRISGVFAGDLRPGGLYPDFPRIEGAFHAVPDSTR